MLVACSFQRRFLPARNAIKYRLRVSLQTQFEIENNCDDPGIEHVIMHNSAIKMDINDPPHPFMEIIVEIFLKLLMFRKTSSDSFANEHSEKVL